MYKLKTFLVWVDCKCVFNFFGEKIYVLLVTTAILFEFQFMKLAIFDNENFDMFSLDKVVSSIRRPKVLLLIHSILVWLLLSFSSIQWVDEKVLLTQRYV